MSAAADSLKTVPSANLKFNQGSVMFLYMKRRLSNMNYEAFSFSVEEYGSELTHQSHLTLYWLNRNGYLNNEDTEDLVSRMIVSTVPYHPRLGQRLLARFFNKESAENSYVFPITLVEDCYNNTATTDGDDKPKLKVVK